MFENITKLIKYPWSGDFFNRISKASAEIQIPESVTTDIKTGAFMMMVTYALNFVVPVMRFFRFGASSYYVADTFGILLTGIFTCAVGGAIMYLVINYFTGDKVRKPMPYFILFILAGLSILSSLYSLSSAIRFLSWNPIAGLVSFVAVAVQVLGLINIAVGCIDFCLASNPE